VIRLRFLASIKDRQFIIENQQYDGKHNTILQTDDKQNNQLKPIYMDTAIFGPDTSKSWLGKFSLSQRFKTKAMTYIKIIVKCNDFNFWASLF